MTRYSTKNEAMETKMFETFHGFTIVIEPSKRFHLMDILERKGVQIRDNSISKDGKEAYIYISASKSRKQSVIEIFTELKENDFCDLDSETDLLPY